MSQPAIKELTDVLVQLHEAKDRSYKDAWRRRGELIGIFCNIARKYDRLVLSGHETDPDGVERRTDTAADLCIYAAKYVTWLIEQDSSAAGFKATASADDWSATHGHRAVALVLAELAAEQMEPPESLAAAFATIEQPFTHLERILVEQREVSATAKAHDAWQLASGSLAYLWRLTLDDNVAWSCFSTYVASLV